MPFGDGELDTSEQGKAGAAREGVEGGGIPTAVVFGKADAIESPLAGEVDDFLGAQGAAGRQWGSVTVQIDEHALEFDAVQQ